MTDDLDDLRAVARSLGATMTAADLPGPDASPSDLMAKGWTYVDLPRMDSRTFDFLMGVYGEGEYKLLTEVRYAGGTVKRGQILLSPKAVASFRERASEIDERDAGFRAAPRTAPEGR